MGLKRTKLLDVQSITGITTFGIFTVGVTHCTDAELDEITFTDGTLEVICEFCKNLTKLSRQDLFSMRKSIHS